MSDVKFHLNSSNAKQATAINLTFCYSGKRLKLSTGYVIEPRFWNSEKQRVKEVMACPEAVDINEKLEALEERVKFKEEERFNKVKVSK